MTFPSTQLRIDMHVHMVSNGAGGKDDARGWLRLGSAWHRGLAGFMLRQLGVPSGALGGDLDAVYAEFLLKQVRGAESLDAVVLLAHEQVYDADGTLRRDLGTMYVPNDTVLELARRHPEFLAGVSAFTRLGRMRWRSWNAVRRPARC